jgi:hypothetical protein
VNIKAFSNDKQNLPKRLVRVVCGCKNIVLYTVRAYRLVSEFFLSLAARLSVRNCSATVSVAVALSPFKRCRMMEVTRIHCCYPNSVFLPAFSCFGNYLLPAYGPLHPQYLLLHVGHFYVYVAHAFVLPPLPSAVKFLLYTFCLEVPFSIRVVAVSLDNSKATQPRHYYYYNPQKLIR